jgi:hypothetical protein
MAGDGVSPHPQVPLNGGVVPAGAVHTWKPGIPAQVQRQAQVPYRVILSESPERLEPENITTSEADYLWLGLPVDQ